MSHLDDMDLAQIAARKKASEEAKKKLDEILAKHRKAPPVKITREMRREAKNRDDAFRRDLPDY